nr:hypothetical protein [Bacillus sp. RIT694]
MQEPCHNFLYNLQDSLSRITNKICKVDAFQLGLTYIVILRAGKISKTLSFNLDELTEEEYQ